jgi:hypothetical protein
MALRHDAPRLPADPQDHAFRLAVDEPTDLM